MAKKQNPYQLWLGLNPNLTNPNLFQLLGVDPRSQDEAAIKQKAVTSAKALLQKLKAVQAKSDTEKVFKQKLHAKIVLAHETMMAPEKRGQYYKTLVAKAVAQKQAAATPVSPPANTAAANQAPPTAPVSPPLNPNAGNPPAEIPTAIPMAIPISSTPEATIAANGPEDAAAFSMLDAPVGQSGPNFDNLDDEPLVKVYSRKRKTSRSWVVPIVVLTLLVGGVGGLISLMTTYSNIFVVEVVPSLKGKVDVVVVDDSKPLNKPTPTKVTGDGSKTIPLTVPETPNQAIVYNGDEDPKMEIPEGGMPRLVDQKNKGSMTKPGVKSEMKPEVKKTQSNPRDTEKGDPKETDVAGDPNKKRTLSDSKVSSIRMGLQRSRDALFRQDRGLAKHFNSDVENLLKRYKIANTETITPKHRGLIRAVKTNEQIIGWVDDFWKQVKSSSIEMAGGESITIGDKTMALVEGTEEGVVLRVAGQNERIRYSNLTPILATTLGELGSKKSVPRWNLAQAAYLGVMADQYSDVKQLQNRLLNQLEIDGFDIESQAISDFTEPDWLELGLPKKKMAPLSDDRFNELIANQRKQLDYKDPSSLPVERTDEIIYKLTLNLRNDPAIRVARLWEAIAMIKKGRRTCDLMYVNRELNNCCTEVDFNRSFVDPILQIAKEEKAPAAQDQVARQTIIFVKQFGGNPSFTPAMREKLVQCVRKIAKDLESGQLAAMAEQVSTASN